MQWHFTYDLVPLLVAAIICFALSIYVVLRRKTAWAKAYALMMSLVAVWAFGYMMELASLTLPDKIFWTHIQYFGIVSIPTLWMLFISLYTGRDKWITRVRLGVIFIIPLAGLILELANNYTGLVIGDMRLVTTGP